MAKIHRGATVTPHFRDFLPVWLVAQNWYTGPGEFAPVASWRLEDPAGQVGLETWLLRNGDATLCVPLSYRGAPRPHGDKALVAVVEHSVLGTRWIYDAELDPVYVETLWAFIEGRAEAEPSGRTGAVETTVRGVRTAPREGSELAVSRRLDPDSAPGPRSVGAVHVAWADGSQRLEACAAEFVRAL